MYHAHTYTIHMPYIHTYTICWPRLPRADTRAEYYAPCLSRGVEYDPYKLCTSHAHTCATRTPHAYVPLPHTWCMVCVLTERAQAMREAVRAAERRAAAAEVLLGQAPVRHSYTIETHV